MIQNIVQKSVTQIGFPSISLQNLLLGVFRKSEQKSEQKREQKSEQRSEQRSEQNNEQSNEQRSDKKL